MLAAFIVFGAFAQSSCVHLRSGPPKQWPSCVLHDTILRSPQPVFADVRGFISHPDSVRHRIVTFTSEDKIGMALQEQPHDLGEIVKDVIPGSQSESAGVKKGWIITEIDGKPFSPQERLKDVAEDFASAKKEGATLTVKYDVRTYLDCTNGDCSHSDKFPTDSLENCADACAAVSACDWWSFGLQDGDNMCLLQSQGSSSLVASIGSSSASSTCTPHPAVSFEDVWPSCIVSDSHIYNDGSALFADVRPFITRADDVQHRTITFRSASVGMGLTDGGVINEVLPDSQAFKAGVQEGWIVKELDGKPFNKAESLPLVRQDFDEAKSEATGLIVKFDVMSARDCTNGDCTNSDKLPVASEAACATVCGKIPSCKWWSVGVEESDKMCWLRRSDKGLKPMAGSSAGTQSCQPQADQSWSSWCLVLVFIAAVLYRSDVLSQVHDLNILQFSRASLSSEGFKCRDYGSGNATSYHQELARVDAFAGTRQRTSSR
jgi:hypothetical protein